MNLNFKWYWHVWKNYGNFEGSATREEYWTFTLFSFLIGLGITILSLTEDEVVIIFNWIYSLAIFIPSLAVMVRRLHHVGKSGWMVLVMLIPIVGAIYLIILLCGKGGIGYAPSYPD